jgi:outer membrane protein, multidrug efflux system
MRKLFYLSIIILLLGSCKAGKPYQGANVLVPGQFKTDLTDEELISSDTVNTDSIPKIGNANILWWESFDDPVLNDLIQKSLVFNRNALIATERIMQARYALKIQNANFLPMIGAQASAERGNFLFNQIGQVNELFIAGSGLYWEIDFWGRIRNLSDAARFNLLSSEYGLQSIQISLISDVASTYFNFLQAREEFEIAKRNLALRDSMHQIILLRFEKGIVPQTDVDQSQILKAIAAGSVPRFQRKTVQLENALSFLVGMNPMHIAIGKPLQEQKFSLDLTGFRPSDLLSNRPDIIAAEYSLMAQNSQVSAAKANRLPTLSLNATLGIISDNISDLSLKNPLWNLGGQLAGPIFFWGQLRRQVDIAQSQEYQALFAYENTVLNAFREIEDLKIEISTLKEEIKIAEVRKASALNAQYLSGERYSQGITSYLEFLESQRQAFDAELELVQLQQQLLSAHVRFYRATGGGPAVQ